MNNKYYKDGNIMKKLTLSITIIIIMLGCDRQWDNPLTTDDDLKNTPNIVQINLDSNNDVNIILDYDEHLQGF